jgi:hypothetical protein
MSETMNGALPPEPAVALANPLVKYFEDLAMAAKRGEVVSAGTVVIGPQGQIATTFLGPRMGDMHLGSVLLGAALLDAIRNPRRENQSRILRPLVG